MTETDINTTPPVSAPPPEAGGLTGGASPAERPERSPAPPGNPTDLLESYRTLQAEVDRLRASIEGGSPPVPPPTTPAPDAAAEASIDTLDAGAEEKQVKDVLAGADLDYDALSTEFNTSGELSAESYKALSEAGLPRGLVDSYIAGQQALAEQLRQDVFGLVGGEGNYAAMGVWASTHLPGPEVNAFNTLLDTGSPEQVRLAVRGLHDAWRAADGNPPQLVMGGASRQPLEPFQSKNELITAMSDPRYAKDPAYREGVHRKLALTQGR